MRQQLNSYQIAGLWTDVGHRMNCLRRAVGDVRLSPYQLSWTLPIHLQGLGVPRCIIGLRGLYFHFHLLSHLADKICSQFINTQRIDPAYAALIILTGESKGEKLSDSCLVYERREDRRRFRSVYSSHQTHCETRDCDKLSPYIVDISTAACLSHSTLSRELQSQWEFSEKRDFERYILDA